MRRHLGISLSILLLAAVTIAARAQATTDFTGQWKQDNDRCVPARSGDVTLRIEHRGTELTVETTVLRGSQNPRHAVQKYTTDGKVSVSIGADGDEFYTSVAWKNLSLVFSIEEHEDGRILSSKETWSVIEDGATLERIRERPNGERQALFFRRITVSSSDNKSGFQKGA
jgi:outer membrane biogenesis lipoprotein LolB